VPISVEYVRTLVGSINAQIRARVAGHLASQNYSEGSPVKAGDLLFQVDPRPFQAAADQADAKLNLAESQLSQAKAQVSASQAQVEQAIAKVAQDEAQVKRAEATQRQTELDVSLSFGTLGTFARPSHSGSKRGCSSSKPPPRTAPARLRPALPGARRRLGADGRAVRARPPRSEEEEQPRAMHALDHARHRCLRRHRARAAFAALDVPGPNGRQSRRRKHLRPLRRLRACRRPPSWLCGDERFLGAAGDRPGKELHRRGAGPAWNRAFVSTGRRLRQEDAGRGHSSGGHDARIRSDVGRVTRHWHHGRLCVRGELRGQGRSARGHGRAAPGHRPLGRHRAQSGAVAFLVSRSRRRASCPRARAHLSRSYLECLHGRSAQAG
jgi:Biotin-lipoyl like